MISFLSTWTTGAINGYLHKEKGLPASYNYTVMSLATGVSIMKTLGVQELPLRNPGLVPALFLGIPVLVGSLFCMGSMVGKSARHLSDQT